VSEVRYFEYVVKNESGVVSCCSVAWIMFMARENRRDGRKDPWIDAIRGDLRPDGQRHQNVEGRQTFGESS